MVPALALDPDRSTALARFRTALATVATAPVDMVFVGDSVTEGADATTMDSRWIARVRDALQAQYNPAGVTGGEGYLPGFRNYLGAAANGWTLTGSIGQALSYGLGRKAVTLDTTDTISGTFTGTQVQIWYTKTVGGGTFSVSIDGGAATQIDTSNATVADGQVWDSAVLTAGAHTVAIAVVSGTVVINGAMVRNGDAGAGVRMWDGGRSGALAQDFAADTTWTQQVGAINPALVVITLGANDQGASRTQVQFDADMDTIIAAIKAACATTPSIVLCSQAPRTGASLMENYALAMKLTGDADADVVFCDLRHVYGYTSFTDGLTSASGTVHLTDAGAALWADALTGFLLNAGAVPAHPRLTSVGDFGTALVRRDQDGAYPHRIYGTASHVAGPWAGQQAVNVTLALEYLLTGHVRAETGTIAGWAMFGDASTTRYAVTHGPAGGNRLYVWKVATSGNLRLGIGGNSSAVARGGLLPADTWVFYAAVWNGATVTFYVMVQGEAFETVGTVAYTGLDLIANSIVLGANTTAGAFPQGGPIGAFLTSWDALSAAEVERLAAMTHPWAADEFAHRPVTGLVLPV